MLTMLTKQVQVLFSVVYLSNIHLCVKLRNSWSKIDETWLEYVLWWSL